MRDRSPSGQFRRQEGHRAAKAFALFFVVVVLLIIGTPILFLVATR